MLIVCSACRRQYDVSGIAAGEHVRCLCSRLLDVPRARAVEARAQRCSACGGALEEGASSCAYCGAAVGLGDRGLAEACPSCFARLAVGDRYCGSCGIEIRPERIAVVPADARCPRCRRELASCTFETGESYVECAGCGGLWLDELRFESIVQQRDRSPLGKLAWERARAEEAARAAEATFHGVAYLACPQCRQPMHRKNFASASGVIIDWCKGHGFWFDTAELERILRFVEKGGLDRARERHIEAQRFEAQRLEARTERARRVPFEPSEQPLSVGRERRQPQFLEMLADWISEFLIG